MTSRHRSHSQHGFWQQPGWRRLRWFAGAAALVLCGLFYWALDDAETSDARRSRDNRRPVSATPSRIDEAVAQPAASVFVTNAALREPDGVVPDSDAKPGLEGERRHPHPIDDTRRRIYRENNFNASLAGAMNVGDYLGLRALIEDYRVDYPEDEYRLQEGYSLVADCMERLTKERQEVARDYWAKHRGSLVRRFIRRHCLDRPAVDGI